MTLTNEYQFIGCSNYVPSNANWYNYYILLYAKTVEDINTGSHTVYVKQRLACDIDRSFYGYHTRTEISVDGTIIVPWEWERIPNTPWNNTVLTENGISYPMWIDLREVSSVIPVGYGTQKDIRIESRWDFGSDSTASHVPISYWKATVDATVTLPIVGGASEIIAAPSVTLGDTCNVQWAPMAASFHYRLVFALGDFSYTTPVVHPNTTAAYSYPFDTNGHFGELARRITGNPPVGDAKVTLYTYMDSNASEQIGAADTRSFSVTVPNNADTAPIVAMELTPVHDLASKFAGLYIQGISRVRAAVTGTGKYGASIGSTSMAVDGTSRSSLTSGYLAASGNVPVVGYATDSRGFTGSNSQTIRVIAYSPPTVLPHSDDSAIKCGRCDEDGNYADNGACLRIRARRSYYPVISGNTQMNFCLIHYRIKEEGGSFSEWHPILSGDAGPDNVDTGAISLGLSSTKSYTVELEAVDDITAGVPVELFISTESVTFHLAKGGYGVGVGKYAEGNGFECAYPAYFYAGIHIPGSDKSLEERIAELEEKISRLT